MVHQRGSETLLLRDALDGPMIEVSHPDVADDGPECATGPNPPVFVETCQRRRTWIHQKSTEHRSWAFLKRAHPLCRSTTSTRSRKARGHPRGRRPVDCFRHRRDLAPWPGRYAAPCFGLRHALASRVPSDPAPAREAVPQNPSSGSGSKRPFPFRPGTSVSGVPLNGHA